MTLKKIKEKFQRKLKKSKDRKNSLLEIKAISEQLNDLLVMEITERSKNNHPNPLNKFGKKCFSQTDEDGITIEILKRIKKLSNGSFAELGVGDGTENNTLILIAMGWRGFWVGGGNLAIDINANNKKIKYLKSWITKENILQTFQKGMNHFNFKNIDLISIDLDGNDYYIVETLLKNKIFPKIFILEYNGKFPPPIKFKIDYNPKHSWSEDDYFGASLSTFNELMKKNNYKLICCNSHSGANCFFIKKEFARHFKDIPKNIEKIYCEPRYILYKNYVHKKSPKLIEQIINS